MYEPPPPPLALFLAPHCGVQARTGGWLTRRANPDWVVVKGGRRSLRV